MSVADYDVAIVGCGPVGATAANLFGQAGLRTLVIERETAPYPLPRAVHIDHEMMRYFQAVDLARDILPLMREAQGHIHIGADGGVIRYLGSKGLAKRFGWANDYFFFQPELEAALRAGAQRFPNVSLLRASVNGITQDSDGVTLTCGGETARARYVVACDGASSFVRKQLGIALRDLNFEQPWLVVDAELGGPIHFPPFTGVPAEAELENLSVMLCDPNRPSTLVPGRGRHRRWEFMLLPGESDEAMMQPGRVKELLAPFVGGEPHQLLRAATYRFHGLIAERWQDRRVFLAGDAAHQTPPFFGQGMCHGIRDVANLAWKLAFVLKRDGDPDLLATYQIEREPQVRAVVDAAIAAGRYICERDPQAARKRDETLRAAMGKPAPKSASDLIPPLAAGVIESTTPGAGARFIQPMVVSDGRRMLLDDATGGGFVLLGPPGFAAALAPSAAAAWQALGGKSFDIGSAAMDDVEGALIGWLKQHDAAAVILRPDFYVYGTAYDAASAARVIARLSAMVT
ncbi:MAG: bifunctional 3-(3-hydroxy-phenyl)propionate/3-hydroxycinnamic acid hydroxylase [Pseudolabrys sp.]|nr:bifunctional 3-(3-hydroxy-phenyl)propionate/3-hydroxycinnamic acid hydroxylase [Pseudolabrys sp.]